MKSTLKCMKGDGEAHEEKPAGRKGTLEDFC
jgi:hypothetical protein